MSEAHPPIDEDEAALAELVAKDLDAVRRVHAELMAATGVEDINSLGRTYQRVSRSLRQTLALKAKLKREAAQDAARAAQRHAPPAFDPDDELAHEWRVEQRLQTLQDGVGAVITAFAAERPDWLTELYTRFDRELDACVTDRFFMQREIDDQVRDVCARLRLPADLAAAWRTLPRPAATPDPATRAADPPWADTG